MCQSFININKKRVTFNKKQRKKPKNKTMLDTVLKHTTPILSSVGMAQAIEPSTTKNIVLATIIYLIQLGVKKLWTKYIDKTPTTPHY